MSTPRSAQTGHRAKQAVRDAPTTAPPRSGPAASTRAKRPLSHLESRDVFHFRRWWECLGLAMLSGNSSQNITVAASSDTVPVADIPAPEHQSRSAHFQPVFTGRSIIRARHDAVTCRGLVHTRVRRQGLACALTHTPLSGRTVCHPPPQNAIRSALRSAWMSRSVAR